MVVRLLFTSGYLRTISIIPELQRLRTCLQRFFHQKIECVYAQKYYVLVT